MEIFRNQGVTMNNIKKALNLLLALIAVLPACAGCSSGTGNNSKTTTPAPRDKTTEAAETEYITYQSAGLLQADFEGHEFTFITKARTDAGTWWYIDVEGMDGEVLNDAIYERNSTIEEACNITISDMRVTDITADVPKLITAGDVPFDVIFCAIDNTSQFIANKYLIDLNTVENIDLSRDWWDQECVRNWTINDKLFLITGDISPSVNMRIYAMALNKDLCRNLGLDLPYQTVLDGQWTLDFFSNFVRGVNSDINGDSIMNFDDRWGFLAVSGESTKQLIAVGGKQTEIRNGKLEFVLNEEANTMRFMDTLKTVADNTVTILADPYAAEHGWPAVTNWFANGGALIKASCFEDTPKDLRPLDTDFGILPYPKYDEAQEEYIALVANSGYVLSIPITQTDTARTGYILEAMTAESVNTVSVALYDVSLQGKTTRDIESEAMLDILFDNKFFDIAYGINLGGIWAIVDELEAGKSDSVASSLAANSDKLEAAVAELNEAFE